MVMRSMKCVEEIGSMYIYLDDKNKRDGVRGVIETIYIQPVFSVHASPIEAPPTWTSAARQTCCSANLRRV
jgi:hypothetical protein